MRISTAVKRFGIQLKADGKSEHTRGAYLRDLRRFQDCPRTDPEVISITSTQLARHLAAN